MAIDLSLVIAANVAPYGIVAVLFVLRRMGQLQRRSTIALAAVVLYALVIALAPVGEVARAVDGWGFYVFLFIVLGSVTWLSFLLWWAAWLVWTGRLTTQHRPDDKYPAFFLYRRSGPAFMAATAVTAGLLPWIVPAGQLPGGAIWLIPMAAVVGIFYILATAVNVSDRAPRFLLPPDLAAQPKPAGDPFWVDVVFVIVTVALAAAPLVAIQNSTHWSAWTLRALSLPVVLAAAVPAYGISRLVKRLVQP